MFLLLSWRTVTFKISIGTALIKFAHDTKPGRTSRYAQEQTYCSKRPRDRMEQWANDIQGQMQSPAPGKYQTCRNTGWQWLAGDQLCWMVTGGCWVPQQHPGLHWVQHSQQTERNYSHLVSTHYSAPLKQEKHKSSEMMPAEGP